MLNFIDDLAGAISDLFKAIPYFIAGFIIVAAPIYLFSKFFEWLL
jgi:hypothetical protein